MDLDPAHPDVLPDAADTNNMDDASGSHADFNGAHLSDGAHANNMDDMDAGGGHADFNGAQLSEPTHGNNMNDAAGGHAERPPLSGRRRLNFSEFF